MKPLATNTFPSLSVDGDFWESTPLTRLTEAQWELLCDGCARCCLQKLEDAQTGAVYYTRVACRLLDLSRCRCLAYGRRFDRVPTCLELTPDTILQHEWLPHTCAYRLLAQGHPLPYWHPLISKDAASVHGAGISVRDWALSENHVPENRYVDYIIALDK